MKRFLLFITAILILHQNHGFSQHCGSIYTFEPRDSTKQTIIGSTKNDKNEARASGRTCAIQTNDIPVIWNEGERTTRIYLSGVFKSTGNLESRDLIWLVVRVNGRVAKSVIVKGVPNQTIYQVSDSLDVPKGSKVTLRTAMIVNEPVEEIWLESGYLQICQNNVEANPVSKPTASSLQNDEEQEPQLQVVNSADVVRLSWKSGFNPNANCFRVERVDESGKWEVIGYVKETCKSKATCEHVFIDSNPLKSSIGYRLYRVDSKGKSFMLAEESRPTNQ
jgi:hypothetical protein